MTTTGRWRCLLCQWPRWITGTYEDYMEHYRLTHQKEEQWIT